MRSVAGGLKRGVGERSGLAGCGVGKESGAFGLPGMGTVTVLPDRCCDRSESGSTTSPRAGSVSFWTAKLSRTCRPVTAWAASTRLAEKWPLIHSRKKALGTWTSRALPSPLKPRWTSSPNQRLNRSSPSRSATAARSADSKARWSAVAVEPGTPSCTWPGCATIAPSPAPSSMWAYACVLGANSGGWEGTPEESDLERF